MVKFAMFALCLIWVDGTPVAYDGGEVDGTGRLGNARGDRRGPVRLTPNLALDWTSASDPEPASRSMRNEDRF